MLDTVIRGGRIIDGTGSAGRSGDVGIKHGVIVVVGGKLAEVAREEIDADGAIVTPGFIDPHTHYDGQIFWDDQLDSSFSAGITTVVAGNCGVGFAPFRPEYRQELIDMMEGVEDIPGLVLAEGMDWDWRSFPEYLDRIAERKYTMDVACGMAHAPLRVFVMGERALRHEVATDEDIQAMAEIVRGGMVAGAAGFSSGRILEHRSSKGDMIPGTLTEERELLEIAKAMGTYGTGVFQIVPKGASGNNFGLGISPEERAAEYRLMADISKASGRPLTYVLLQDNSDPNYWKESAALAEKYALQGADIWPQISARQITLFVHIDGYHPFRCRPTYMKLHDLPRAERVKAMRDPATRRAILQEEDVPMEQAPSPIIHHFAKRFFESLGGLYLLSMPIDYEPDDSKRVGHISKQSARPMDGIVYDWLTEGVGDNIAVEHVHNYTRNNLQDTYELFQHERVLSGLGDGGAHIGISCDAAMPTFQLAFWTRDRTRGPKIAVEEIVRRMTSQGASVYSMNDRGILAPGKRADINIIDLAKISVDVPEYVYDLPSGGPRFVQKSHGFLATMVKGQVTRRFDEDCGRRPGRLLRTAA
jgi:N-acyl-D-amino-acid deacylase